MILNSNGVIKYKIDALQGDTPQDFLFIYVLKDPVTKQIRYIGKTNNLYKRYMCHLSQAKAKNFGNSDNRKSVWIKGLMSKNLAPDIEVLEATTKDKIDELEKNLIKKFLNDGCNLLNIVFVE